MWLKKKKEIGNWKNSIILLARLNQGRLCGWHSGRYGEEKKRKEKESKKLFGKET